MTEQEASHIEYWVMGFNHGINQEQERIIKLLEDKAPKCNEQEYNFLGCDCSISYHDAIALIKEENK